MSIYGHSEAVQVQVLYYFKLYSLSVTYNTKITFMRVEHFQENVYVHKYMLHVHSIYCQVIVLELLSFILFEIELSQIKHLYVAVNH